MLTDWHLLPALYRLLRVRVQAVHIRYRKTALKKNPYAKNMRQQVCRIASL
jgi:hypothetical protein